MPMHNKGLTKLSEECAEVVQVACKWMALGVTKVRHWDGSNLRLRLQEEIGDALAAIIFVIAKFNLDQEAITKRTNKKLALFNKWDNEEG